MKKVVVGVLMLLVIACTAYAEVEGAAYCHGMARALKLPDTKIFENFMIINDQGTLSLYGNTSGEYLKHIQNESYRQGLGAGLGIAILADNGADYAFKFFMVKCYENNYKTRTAWLAVEDPK